MRKTFTCILLAAIFTTACQNRLNHNGALGAVEEAFYNQYPNAWDVEWEHGAGNTIVMDFKDGLYEREAWFLTDGTWTLHGTTYLRRADNEYGWVRCNP